MRNLPDLRRTPSPARTTSSSDPWEEDQYASLGFESEAPTDDELARYDDEEETVETASVGRPVLAEESLRFLRDFIIGSGAYVEELESETCDRSDEYWESRDEAYRIITGLLIDTYRYELAGEARV